MNAREKEGHTQPVPSLVDGRRPGDVPSGDGAVALPLAFILALAAISCVPSIVTSPPLVRAIAIAVVVLLTWYVALCVHARTSGHALHVDVVVRQQHYIQTCAQASVLLYWGWYWRPVYDEIPLIAAQLLFAYAFGMLLAWSRRRRYPLGFGPLPIVFSVNLFLWFKAPWFVLQFGMIALGIFAKEFIQTTKHGRRVHVCNPSAFPLAVVSLALIAMKSTDLTFGQEIATTFEIPPHMALWIFVAGLPGQLLFGVTSMTMSAVVTLFVVSGAYHAVTGMYVFVDSYIPTPVFLGMHLLFTDPSTSPRTDVGRVGFGVLYGVSVAMVYALLDAIGAPTFYDKLLPVPLLNLASPAIDRAARFGVFRRLGGSVVIPLTALRKHGVYVAIWTVVFAGMTVVQGVGDVRESHWMPLWERACEQRRGGACQTFAKMLTYSCVEGSAWACNEVGILIGDGLATSGLSAAASFQRACDLGSSAGCENARSQSLGTRVWRRLPPNPLDYAVMVQEDAGRDTPPSAIELLRQACGQGWKQACGQLSKTPQT